MKLPHVLKNEACNEAYKYFNREIRPLPKTADGKINPLADGFSSNDVDAFRHAYVSGAFVQEYNERAADIFGQLNEWGFPDLYSNQMNPGDKNMDLWNNAIGRKYGAKAKSRRTLLRLIHKAMKNGELILTPEDMRKYQPSKNNSIGSSKPIIVLQQNKKGRNKVFFDTKNGKMLTVHEFITLIKAGEYPSYTVKMVKGSPTPVSNPDNRETNNLG